MCLACAIPVRGLLIGPECLRDFVDDAPVVEPSPGPDPRVGDRLALAGFAVVLVASFLPWARFADPRLFGAWVWGWSLYAPAGAMAGLAAAFAGRLRPLDLPIEAALYVAAAIAAGAGALLYRLDPPVLAGSSLAPLLALAGAATALVGGVRKAAAFWLTR
jgi:hypothetical protein